MNIAIIGYGFAGRCFHSYLVPLTAGLTLRGIASRSPETRQRIVTERGCRAYESVEQVLDDPAVDLVVIATPHDTHAELAIAALAAGRHVVTDKVMCLNGGECDRMIAAAGKSGKMLTVFHNRRWDGDFLTLKQCMADGTLGEVKWIEMAWTGFGPYAADRWRGQAKHGGGRFFDLGAHMLDQALQFFPQPVESVYCRMHHDFATTDTESQAMVVLTFAGGATAVVDASGLDPRNNKPRFLARGTKASFKKFNVDPQEQAMIKGDIDSAVEDPQWYAFIHDGKIERRLPTLAGRWRSFYENVAAVLQGRAEPAITLAQMRRLMAVVDAALESARSGQTVRPPPAFSNRYY